VEVHIIHNDDSENVMHMPRPFEGVFGNTCELRLLEFLLPLEGMEFNVTELSEEVGVSRVTAGRVVKKFVAWGILNASNRKIPRYSINPSSPIIRALESVNNALIGQIIAEEKEEEGQDMQMLMKKHTTTLDLLAK
jgi:hypothetical protein